MVIREVASWPFVSVVILNYNGKEFLKCCLRSVLDSDYPNFEVIVVDNGSTDSSAEFVKEMFGGDPRLKILLNHRNLGFAEGNNVGIKVAKGKYIVLLNNDTETSSLWLKEIAKVMESDLTAGACQSKLLLMSDRKTLDSVGAYLSPFGLLVHKGIGEVDRGQFDNIHEIFTAKGAALTIRREVLEEVGLFDSEFFAYLEETDLCWRIWLSGYTVLFVPRSIVYHAWGSTLSKIGPLYARYILRFHATKNYIKTLLKNLDTRNVFKILPVHICIWLGIVLLFILRRRLHDAMFTMKAICWNLINLKHIWDERVMVQHHIRRVSDNQIFSRIMRKVALRHLYLRFCADVLLAKTIKRGKVDYI